MTLLEFIIAFVGLLLTNGIFFYSIDRKLRKAEVAEKELDNQRKLDDEWQELYVTALDKNEKLETKLEDLYHKYSDLIKANNLLEMKNQQLTWYRCQVNNCPKRIPPHVFDVQGNELEAK